MLAPARGGIPGEFELDRKKPGLKLFNDHLDLPRRQRDQCQAARRLSPDLDLVCTRFQFRKIEIGLEIAFQKLIKGPGYSFQGHIHGRGNLHHGQARLEVFIT